MKKIAIFLLLLLVAGAVFGQNIINGYSDLAFGTALDTFLNEYEGFNPIRNIPTDLVSIGVLAYRRVADRRVVNILFFENKFYEALIQYMNPSSRETNEILQNYVNQYGRPNDKEEAGGRYPWVKYFWNINEHFVITAFVQSGTLEIRHYDPIIKNVNNITF